MAAFVVVLLVAAGWRPGDRSRREPRSAAASGAAFAAVVLGQVANAFACRSSSRPVWRPRVRTTNRLLSPAIASELACCSWPARCHRSRTSSARRLTDRRVAHGGGGDPRGGAGGCQESRRSAADSGTGRRRCETSGPLPPSRLDPARLAYQAPYTPALGFAVRSNVSRSTSCSPSWGRSRRSTRSCPCSVQWQ